MSFKKTFQELEFHDSFMFAAAMEDEEICRGVLELILDIPVRSVKVQSEHVLLFNSDYRGIRMDVFADDEAGTIYDVEMQTANRGNLPKRSRFYQAQMDVSSLKPGEDFNRLPRSFVIFLCMFDPFGRGYYRYVFEERCREDGGVLGDGTCKVFLNTKGLHKEYANPQLVRFLEYLADASAAGTMDENALISQIDTRITSLKRDRRMEERYMLFGEMLDEERKEGVQEGILTSLKELAGKPLEEREKILYLIRMMETEKVDKEIPRLLVDPVFLQKMFEEYHPK